MMSDQEQAGRTEERVGLDSPEAFEIKTDGVSVTGTHLYADGDGQEKEVNVLSPHSGASSDAPASSGIPSAVTQSGLRRLAAADQDETPMEDRDIPTRQNLEP